MTSMERCRKAEIYNAGHHLICDAVVSVGPANDLILNVPAPFPHEDISEVYIKFFHPVSGLIQTRCSLSGYVPHLDQRATMRCTILETISEEQRRNDLKVPLDLDLEATLLRSPSSFKPETSSFLIRTRDISAGGVYLISPYDLEEGTLLLFQLSMTKPPLRLTARVLRSEPLSVRKGLPQYGLGCQFVSMDSPTESGLRSFVFRQERQMHRR